LKIEKFEHFTLTHLHSGSSNPVDLETGSSFLFYSHDNFLYQVDTDGSPAIGTCDDRGICAAVELASCPESYC